jgi:hypothetical protein
MSWLLSLAAGIGIPEPFRKAAVIGTGVLLLLLAVFAAVKIHDSRVISAHDAKQGEANAKADRAADSNAADSRVTDAARQKDESTQAQEAIDEARRNGTDPRKAYYACVSKQQLARRNNAPVPSC